MRLPHRNQLRPACKCKQKQSADPGDQSADGCTVIALTALMALSTLQSATLSGVVRDPSGATVPGASVELRCPGRSGVQHLVTAVSGEFSFGLVESCRYELTVQRASFQTARLRIVAGGNRSPRVEVRLEIENLLQQVTLSAGNETPSAETGANADAQVLDRRALETLPSLGDNVVETLARFLDPALAGSSGVTLVVDGMETDKLGVSASAIQEVRINQNPFSAEFSSPGRGRIEVFTKQEAAEHHGELRYRLRHWALDARNAFAPQRPAQSRLSWEGHWTGPLGKQRKTSFLVSGEVDRERDRAVVFAQTPTGLWQQNYPTPQRDDQFSLRLNHRPGEKSLLALRFEQEMESTSGDGVGQFVLPESAASTRDLSRSLYFKHQVLSGSRLAHDLQARLRLESEAQTSALPNVPRIVVPGAFTGGGAQTNNTERQRGIELSQVVSVVRGSHFVRAGTALRDLSRRRTADLDERQGTYYFSNLEDYLSARPYAYSRMEGDGRLAWWTGDAAAFIQDEIKLRRGLSLGAGLRFERSRYPADSNNFAPRLALAFAPGREPRTVLRAGAGFFYDRVSTGALKDVLMLQAGKAQRILIVNPDYPVVFASSGAVQALPQSVVRFDPALRSPYLVQYSIGVERRLARLGSLTGTYSGVRGVKQFRSRDVNAPFGPSRLRQDPRYGVIRQIESSAGLEAHSLQVNWRGKLGRWVQGTGRYSLGRARNDSGGIGSFPAYSYDLRGEWGRADSDRRHALEVAATVSAGRWFDLGWVLELQSGRPYSLTTGRDDNGDGSARDRPPGVARNTLQGPGRASVDVRLSKKLPLKGGEKDGPSLGFAMDAFNVFNQVNYTGFVGNLSSPFFGRAVSAQPARRLQIGLRFEF